MESYIEALQKIIPKELHILKRRYRMLRGIQLFQPIGRRSLSNKIHIPEKIVRTDTDFLRKEGCIVSTGTGMTIESSGEQLLSELKSFIKLLEGLTTIEERVKEILECREVVVVSGDADQNDDTIYDIGYAAAKVLLRKISDHDTIAITGGSTVYNVIEAIPTSHIKSEDVLVVPARGSLGTNVAYQANTLVAMLADKIHCRYKLLNIPDNLSKKALKSVSKEPDIQKTLGSLIKANVLIYGIGNAFKMASRRNLSEDILELLNDRKATAEAMGYYFDDTGKVIYTSGSVGITVDQMTELKFPIAVAGGSSKSRAILSVKEILSQGCVIMDEGAARGIIALVESRTK